MLMSCSFSFNHSTSQLSLSLTRSMEGEDGEKVRRKMAEIDTRAPFRSVKEAVSLFGDKVLAGELYLPNNFKQMNIRGASHKNGHNTAKANMSEPTTKELEETKQSLKKAREESEAMASNLSSLQQELAQTKRELTQLKKKDQESEKHILVENSSKYIEIKAPSTLTLSEMEFQKKRYVTFADPPPTIITSTTPQSHHQVVHVDAEIGEGRERDGVFLKRHPSLKKKKKKPLIPLIGAIFSKKKGTQDF